jgi:bifunctional UDP-N-acetylglucosamine pyrophosphorylase/glucosamine-1-phosphate N-acetyltransferase
MAEFYKASFADAVVSAVNTPDKFATGILIIKGEALLKGLAGINYDKAEREYSLSDVSDALQKMNYNLKSYHSDYPARIFTRITNHIQLAEAAAYLRAQINDIHMGNGVQMYDPLTAYIDETVKIAEDVIIYPNVILEGNCVIEAGAVIGPDTQLVNVIIGSESRIQNSVLIDARVGKRTEIGPFAYLRPGAVIGDDCRVGDFVEVKNSSVGNRTKIAHLGYVGDSDVGENVNWGCGAITANYDGKHKHRTVIGDNVFVGCNSNLIAPVNLGDGAFIAAGSTITDEVPPAAIAIARQRQTTKLNWKNNKYTG